MREIEISRLLEMVSYCPETGILRWKIGRPGASAGATIGCKRSDGYIKICVDGVSLLAHRVAWAITHKEWPSGEIDHRNMNRSDNRLQNLRPATPSQNKANTRAFRSNKSSGLKGASFCKRSGKWLAQIQKDRKPYHLGVFDTAEGAHAAYKVAAERLFGEFARAA
jgi:hypothetical protein